MFHVRVQVYFFVLLKLRSSHIRVNLFTEKKKKKHLKLTENNSQLYFRISPRRARYSQCRSGFFRSLAFCGNALHWVGRSARVTHVRENRENLFSAGPRLLCPFWTYAFAFATIVCRVFDFTNFFVPRRSRSRCSRECCDRIIPAHKNTIKTRYTIVYTLTSTSCIDII